MRISTKPSNKIVNILASWRGGLKTYFSLIHDSIGIARKYHKQKKTRLLIIEDRIPDPAYGYGYPRAYNIIQYLADLGYALTLFPMQFPEKIEPCTSILQQKGIEVMYGQKDTKMDFGNFFRQRKDYYDIVWISRPHNMKELIDIIKQINPIQKIIYDAEALFSAREILKLELEGSFLKDQEKDNMIQEEIRLMDQADVVITVSENERSLIEKYRAAHIGILGQSYDINPTPTPFKHRKDILFVGAFLSSPSPNEDAVQYFVNEIYPKVYKVINAKFFIVGTNYSKVVRNLESDNIIVTGRVDSLYGYFDKCKVFIVPTRYSAGIPLKLQECMSFGLPAVVTPLIAKQLGITENVALIGNSASDFANKIIQCYTNKSTWQSVREKELEYIEKECSPMIYRKKLDDILRMIVN